MVIQALLGENHRFSGTTIPRRMEPPVLFDHCHLRGCDVELEEQCLGLLDQLRYCRHRRHQLYLPRPCSRKYARLAEHCGPDILGRTPHNGSHKRPFRWMAIPNYDGALRTEELGWSVFSNAWRVSRRAFDSGAPPFNAPREAIDKMHRATAALKATGIENRALKVGDRAPSFTLFNQDHEEVASTELLSRGPLVVSFSRGHW